MSDERNREVVTAWREAILAESRDTLAALQQESENHPDFADRASNLGARIVALVTIALADYRSASAG